MRLLRTTTELVFFVIVFALLAACSIKGEGSENEGATTTLTTTTGLLQSIVISPASSSVTACVPTQLSATGYYSDGTSKDVTSSVVWGIDSTTNSIAVAKSSSGMIAGIASGKATVNAWSGNITASSSVITVSGGSLSSIAISPSSSTIAAAATQTYTATATCSNGSFDISAYNIWTSGSTSVATISTSGTATAVAAGSSVITATAGTVSATSVLNVN